MLATPALQTSTRRSSSASAPSRSRGPVQDTARTLERTLGVLLSPLDFADWKSWQRAVHVALLELTGADTLCVYTPLAIGCDAWLSPHLDEAALSHYATSAAADADYDVIEAGYRRFAAANGDGVAHQDELVARGTLEASAFHRDFLLPNRLLDLTVAGVNFGGMGPARLHFGHQKRRTAAERALLASLVRTILPAFRSGLMQWRQMGERRTEVGRVLDVLADAVVVYDTQGGLVHANPAAVAMMGATGTQAGIEVDRLQLEAQRVAWSVGAMTRRAQGSLMGTPALIAHATSLPSATREVRIDAQSFTLRGSLAPSWMLGREPGVIVTIETTSTKAPTDGDLRERFGLTTREVEVARLVASGLSNQALAEKLGVSFFTARNHVERLMGKLGAMNRAHIGAIVRGDAATS